MKLIRDLLLVSIETSGSDPDRDNVLQLAAVLLDKDNLLEKDLFNHYVRISLLESTIAKHAQLLGIPYEVMHKSRKIYDVIKSFNAHFETETLILATHGVNTMLFLRNAYKKSALPFPFTDHSLDIWSLEYLYTLRYGIAKIPSFQTLRDHFGLKQRNEHNALERAHLLADIFRKIIKQSSHAF